MRLDVQRKIEPLLRQVEPVVELLRAVTIGDGAVITLLQFVIDRLIENFVKIEVDDGVDEPMFQPVSKDLVGKRRIVAPVVDSVELLQDGSLDRTCSTRAGPLRSLPAQDGIPPRFGGSRRQ